MSWLFYVLLTALFWGVGQVILKKGLSSISPVWNIFISAILNIIIFGSASLLHSFSLSLTISQVLFLSIIPLLYMLYYYAIEKGQLAFVGTLFAAYPIVTVLLSMFLLHESLTFFSVLMIVLVISGSVILATSDKAITFQNIRYSWVFWGVLGAATTGVADFLVKLLLTSITVGTYNFYYPLFYLFGFLVYLIIDKGGRKRPKHISFSDYKYTICGVLLMNVGILFLNFAFSAGPASLVSTVSSSYAAITVILSYIFLKEKINRRQLLALCLVAIGIVFINLR